MLVFHQRIDPDSRTGRGSAWVAETIVGGIAHSARSRSGAPFSLARQLIAAGVPDQPVQVYTDGIAGCITYRSLAQMAGLTIGESATVPLRQKKWEERDRIWVKNEGEEGAGDAQYPESKKIPSAVTLASKATE